MYIGKKYNRLVALKVHSEGKRIIKGKQYGYTYNLLWKCECGNTKIIDSKSVVNGHTKSCGCLKPEVVSKRSTIHGHSKRGNKSPTFVSWMAMNNRCYTKSSSAYRKYGYMGIAVCERWRHSFKNFLEDMGDRPKGMTLDRIDYYGNYTPENCRWATPLEQANNQKSNVKVEIHGKKMNVSQAMRHYGVYTKSGVYYTRLKRGWSVERTFTTPIQKRGFTG